MKKINFLFMLLFVSSFLKAQTVHDSKCNCHDTAVQVKNQPNECRVDDLMEKFLDLHPDARETPLMDYEVLNSHRHMIESGAPESYVIPVVFHVFGETFNGGTTVDVALVKEALRLTNNDFQGLTEGWENSIHPSFDGIKKKLNMTFKLAQIDPDGNPTNGVTFHPDIAGIGHNNGYDKTIQKYAWDNYKYMNVYIVHDLYNDGDYYNSGVAWYPNKYMSNKNLARVVYNGSYLASNTDKNFRKIITHEFGHWLNLAHTFNGGCYDKTNDADELKNGDYILDTPPANKSKMGAKELNCRGEITNTQNFMNYTKDYAMFTIGQVNRMLAALNHEARKPLWQESNLRATGVAEGMIFGPRLTVSSKMFNEAFANNGFVENKITVLADNGALFADVENFVDGMHYTIENLPHGLKPEIKLINNKKLEISFVGNADTHAKSDNVDDIKISFTKAAFASDFTLLANNTVDEIKIYFKDPYTEYCVFGANWNPYAYINKVEFGTINFSSEKAFYSNNIQSVISNIRAGETYNLGVTVNQGTTAEKDANVVRAWFDWNGDFVFDDTERLLSKTIQFVDADENGNIRVNLDVTIPQNAIKGKTIGMRVFTHFKDSKASASQGENPCGKVDSGEAEDYGLIVISDDAKLEAKFVYSDTDIIFNTPITFSDISTSVKGKKISNWKWSFPGGTPSEYVGQYPPQVYYTEEGTYSVELEITDEDNKKSTALQENIITAKYQLCAPQVSYGTYAGITNVTFNTIDNTSSRQARFNDYYETKSTELTLGETYDLSVTINKGNAAAYDWDRIQAWIDWNYDSYYDVDELIATSKFKITECDKDGNYTYLTKVTVPVDAKLVKTHMRTMVHYVQKNDGETACGSIDSGEIEDYGIVLKKGKISIVSDFIADKVNPKLSEPVTFTDKSSALENDPIEKWEWKFEGGTPAISNKQSPDPVVYTKEGVYDVSVTITTRSGKTATKVYEDYITSQYALCNPDINFSGYCYITNVSIGNIDNTTGDSKMCMSYFNTQETNISQGVPTEISIDIFTGRARKGIDHWLEIWADWNYNGILDDDEIVAKKKIISPAKDTKLKYDFPVLAPEDAALNKVIMRVISYYDNGRELCGKLGSGEAEDYALNIVKNNITVSPGFTANKTSASLGEALIFTNNSFVSPGEIVKSWLWEFPGSDTPVFEGKTPTPVTYNNSGSFDVKLKVTTEDNVVKERLKRDYVSIAYQACTPQISWASYSHITKVVLGNLVNITESDKYTNYMKSHTLNSRRSDIIPLEITTNSGASGASDKLRIRAWADWNHDAKFSESELIASDDFVSNGPDKNHTFKTKINVPSDVASEKVILRTMVYFVSKNQANTACGSIESGEVEDYAINFKRNAIPVANAGDVQSVAENTLVRLKGSASDADNDDLQYTWTAPIGIILSDANIASPTFTAPNLATNESQTYTFTLVVNDGFANSEAETVVITVTNMNNKPIINPVENQIVEENTLVTISSLASDTDDDDLRYIWTAPEGIKLSNVNIASPRFTAPNLTTNKSQTYTFTLVVNDGFVDSEMETILITVTNVNNKPIVNIGENQIVDENTLVTMRGLATDADKDDLSFMWTAPEGIILSDINIENPTFMAPDINVSKDFTFSLVVSDGLVNSNEESVVITVVDQLVTSVNELSHGSFIVYPTIFTNGIYIENKKPELVDRIIIYNLTGYKVYEEEIKSENFTISLSHLSSGMYILNACAGNRLIKSIKIIKK